jgi:hypothetical protein
MRRIVCGYPSTIPYNKKKSGFEEPTTNTCYGASNFIKTMKD